MKIVLVVLFAALSVGCEEWCSSAWIGSLDFGGFTHSAGAICPDDMEGAANEEVSTPLPFIISRVQREIDPNLWRFIAYTQDGLGAYSHTYCDDSFEVNLGPGFYAYKAAPSGHTVRWDLSHFGDFIPKPFNRVRIEQLRAGVWTEIGKVPPTEMVSGGAIVGDVSAESTSEDWRIIWDQDVLKCKRDPETTYCACLFTMSHN